MCACVHLTAPAVLSDVLDKQSAYSSMYAYRVYVLILADFMQSHRPRVMLFVCVFQLGHLVQSHLRGFDHYLYHCSLNAEKLSHHNTLHSKNSK